MLALESTKKYKANDIRQFQKSQSVFSLRCLTDNDAPSRNLNVRNALAQTGFLMGLRVVML